MTHHTIRPDDWRKSSYSQNNGGECVEWAPSQVAANGEVPVRDSKDPQGPVLTFSPAAWSAFLADVKSARFPA
ncbi:MAG: DUF397 domain-containing protein [Streptomyces sp.]|nr:DUF397 domain-containing protein [Streptomyces sp.]NUS11844.1 DUF397 domain-containing protein [Streptomyces sp.]